MVKEFVFINFFRAIAAFWVLIAHCMIWGDWYGIPLPSAKIAVDLFMMISGYLMAANTISRNEIEPLNTSKNCLRFWLRRFFRLAPAYYISLILAVAISDFFLGGYHILQTLNPAKWGIGGVYDPIRIEYTWSNFLLHISFLFGLHPTYSFSTFLPDWSLSLEMQFYFVFPALFVAMKKFGFFRIAFFLGIPIFFIGQMISKSIHYYEPSLLLIKLNYFIAGILLFDLIISANKRTYWKTLICAILLVSMDFNYGKEVISLPILLISMLIFGRLEYNNKAPKWIYLLINNRFIHFASDTSYGVYLFHGFFISSFGWILKEQPELLLLMPYQRVMLMFLFVTVSSYLVGYLCYRFIELPSIYLGKRTIQKHLPLNTK